MCLFIVGIVTRVMLTIFLTAGSDLSDHSSSDAVGRTSTAYGHGESHDTWRRTSFDKSLEGEGCRIFAWPSRGGVVIKNYADAVEMMFLRFDRFDLPIGIPADEQDKEDAFVRELLKVGGKLWQS